MLKYSTMILTTVALMFICSLMLSAHWETQQQEQDRYAATCNKQGGVARMIDGMRQCVKGK